MHTCMYARHVILGEYAILPLMVYTAPVDQTGFGIVGRQWSGVEASVGT